MAKVNNFPNEGDHGVFTQAEIDRLQSQRPKYNQTLDYTIHGAAESQVRSSLECEREAAITNGSRVLIQKSRDLNHDVSQASNQGRAKAQFNHPVDQEDPRRYVPDFKSLKDRALHDRERLALLRQYQPQDLEQ